MSLASIWLITGILLIFSELIIPGFVVIFFGFGALLAAALAFLTDTGAVTQGYVFVISSLLALFIGRRFFSKTLHGKSEIAQGDADDDGIIGAVGTVTHAILPPQCGRIEVRGSDWKAIADRPIDVGATVTVVAQDNITLKVQ